jgi:predicted AAA+ superfamily ATPase
MLLIKPPIVIVPKIAVCSCIGFSRSYNRIKNIFNLGSMNTVKNYTEYLENSFLLFFVDRFSYSGGVRKASPKKVYSIDTGL